MNQGEETLAYDQAETDVAMLRRVAVAVVVISSAALAGIARAWWAYLVAGLSLIAVHFWVKRITLHARRKQALTGRGLLLAADTLDVPHEDGTSVRIERSAIDSIAIDRERLLVCIQHGDACEELEPCFGGLGLDGLAQKLDAWRRKPSASIGHITA